MASLLRRLSLSMTGDAEGPGAAGASTAGLGRSVAHPSFNDFSLHAHEDVHRHCDEPQAPPRGQGAAAHVPARRSFDTGPPTIVVGSAPAGLSPLTKALQVPRPSVAQLFLPAARSSLGGGADAEATPRSSLDSRSASLSAATPRSSLDDETPRTPGSPTTPGGSRRRRQKIHGMDYYEFCELVRAGSL